MHDYNPTDHVGDTTAMTEFFEDKGTWAGLPVTVQGIFEDGECIAVKVLDRTDGSPISWAFNPKMLGVQKAGICEKALGRCCCGV